MEYRVLIVEDDRGIAEALQGHLAQWGLEAKAVTDFRHVMDAFSSARPHLVLMDVALPFMSGYHWCAEIRKVSSVPVIFISSASDNMNIIMAMNMGGTISSPSPSIRTCWSPRSRRCCAGPTTMRARRRCWSTGAPCWILAKTRWSTGSSGSI